jgi:hypothetical protein
MLQDFNKHKVLLAYYGGSAAYKTSTEFSDKDIIVVLDEFNGYDHLTKNEEGYEYFIFGKNQFIDKMNFDRSVTPYLKIFNDDILSDLEPIFLDESFEEQYEALRTRPFSSYIVDYLTAVINYYSVFLVSDILRKNMYHLYRIDEQVKRYLETGEFKLEISEETLEKIMILKENHHTNNLDILAEVRNILEYLKGVRDDVGA